MVWGLVRVSCFLLKWRKCEYELANIFAHSPFFFMVLGCPALGEPSKKKRKNLVFWTKQGGGGLTESQLFVKFFQNQICLGTVHKCDETHTTQMGRQYLINS